MSNLAGLRGRVCCSWMSSTACCLHLYTNKITHRWFSLSISTSSAHDLRRPSGRWHKVRSVLICIPPHRVPWGHFMSLSTVRTDKWLHVYTLHLKQSRYCIKPLPNTFKYTASSNMKNLNHPLWWPNRMLYYIAPSRYKSCSVSNICIIYYTLHPIKFIIFIIMLTIAK